MSKIIKKYDEVKDRIASGVSLIADPVIQTLSPRGGNVMFEDSYGNISVTKDGVTVAKQIESDDPIEDKVIDMVRFAAMRANKEAGDGPQPYWSKVLTPNGFVRMGDLKPGMDICGTNGTAQKVIGVFPKGVKRIFKVNFSDGRCVECSEDHLWSITTSYGVEQTIPLSNFKDRIWNTDQQRSRYYVPNTTVEFDSQRDKMPIEPYTLGLLIGDGSLSGSGTIELSLGKKKEHILDKITLPEGIYTTVSYDKNKNYFRVKILGKTETGHTIKELLDQIGLLGTKSNTKFIPQSYLYSSTTDRERLLQGLIDTDGYVNGRGLIEFSTVSLQLHQDFLELMRGLGRPVGTHVHSRIYDSGSYSDTPIFRISEHKGYKYGLKVSSVVDTGEYTEMLCIKVSNEDCLYITDDYVPTHNTTTATLLTKVMVMEGMKLLDNGMDRRELRDHMEFISKTLLENLEKKKITVDDDKQLRQIALISSNSDEAVADDVIKVIEAAGLDGLVVMDVNHKPTTEVVVEPGFLLNQPLAYPELVQKHGTSAVMDDVPVLITDKRLYYEEEAETILRVAVESGYRKLVIVASDFIGKTPNYFLANHAAGSVELILVKESNQEVLSDLATYLGGNVISEKSGSLVDNLTPEQFIKVERVLSDKVRSIFTSANPDNEAVQERISSLREEIDSVDDSEDLEKRLASLTNGTVTIKVGGFSPVETQEKLFRYDDAINATRAAKKEGYVVGGGLTLLSLLEGIVWPLETMSTVKRYCEASVRQIAENSGKHADTVIEKSSGTHGYNAKTDEYCDLLEAGVIDPYKVTELAIQNSISVATALLTSGYIIVHDKEKDNE